MILIFIKELGISFKAKIDSSQLENLSHSEHMTKSWISYPLPYIQNPILP